MHAAALTPRCRANTRVSSRLAGGLLCAALGLAAVGAAAEPLVIDYIVSNAPQRTTWVGIIDRFAAANPDIQVTHNGYPQEQYKRDFTAHLRGGQVDVAFWYAGERLRDAASNKLLSPLDADMVALLRKNRFAPATIEGTRVDGEVYGFPLYYYVWGFVYRKSLFERLDLRPPAHLDRVPACVRTLEIGGRDAAGDRRQERLAGGRMVRLSESARQRHRLPPQTAARRCALHHARARRVFDVWGDLLRKGYFLDATMDQEPDRVMPYLYRNHVGVALMASSAASKFPTAIAADMGFFGFPRYSLDMPVYEEAPLDVLVMPAAGRNPRARQRFLTFLVESGSLRQVAEADQTLSAQADATTRATLLGPATRATWTGAAGLTYFFDRDATAELVAPGYEGMRRFLKPPHDTDQAVRYIEQQRAAARRIAPAERRPWPPAPARAER